MTSSQNPTNNFREAVITKLPRATADARGFFESVLGFANLAGRYIRVAAADQHRYFGRVVFGRCAVRVEDTGKVSIIKTKAFGKDYDYTDMFYDHANNSFAHFSDGSLIKNPHISL